MTCGIGFVNTPFRASRMIPMKKMIPRQTAVNSRAMATVNFGWAQSFESSVLCRCLYRSAGLLNALPDAKNAADNPVAKLQPHDHHNNIHVNKTIRKTKTETKKK